MTELRQRAWGVAARTAGNTLSPGVTALCLLGGIPVGASTALGALAGSLTEEGIGAIGQLWRDRAERVERFAETAVGASGRPLDDLLAAAAAHPVKLGLLAQAVEAAGNALHESKVDLLARLVAEGVRDDARVDEALIMVDTVRQLELPHLRLLAILDTAPDGHSSRPYEWTAQEIGDVDPGLGEALDGLAAKLQGLALANRVTTGSDAHPEAWRLTRYGRQCLRHLHERA